MKTEEKIVDKVIDTLIDEVSAEAYRKEADYNAPEVNFSPEHKRNMQKLFKNERRKYNLRRATVVTSKIAIFIILLAAITVSLSPNSVEALKTKFLNFFYDKDAPDMEITFTETKNNSYSNDMVDIGYIPDGFELVKHKEGINNLFLNFANEKDYIQLKRNNLSLKMAVNTETGILENIRIKGYEGFYIVKNTETILLWHDGVYTYRINSNLEKNNIVKIAESTTSK